MLDQVLSFSGDEVAPEDVRRMLGLVAEEKYLELAELVSTGDRAGVFPFVQRLLDEGYDPGEFVRGLGEAWRMLLALRMDPEDAATELSESDRASFAELARQFSEEDLLRYLVTTVEFESSGRLRRSTQPRIQLEALLLRLVSMTSYVEFAELVEAVESGVSPSAHPWQPVRRDPAMRPGAEPEGRGESSSTGPEASANAAEPTRSRERSDRSETPSDRVAEAQPPATAWQETLAELRGKGGLGAEGIALTGARVAEGEGGAIVVAVVSGLADDLKSFLNDPLRSGTLRRALARRLDVDPGELELRVEASGRPERLTAAAAQRQRLDRLMEADPNLRDAVQTLDLRLKE
jgi:hypothetical protein